MAQANKAIGYICQNDAKFKTSIGFLLSVYNLYFFVYFVFSIFLYRAAN